MNTTLLFLIKFIFLCIVYFFYINISSSQDRKNNKNPYFVNFYYQNQDLRKLEFSIENNGILYDSTIDPSFVQMSSLGLGYDIGFYIDKKNIFIFDYVKFSITKYINDNLKSSSGNYIIIHNPELHDIYIILEKYNTAFLGFNLQSGFYLKKVSPFIGTSIGLQYTNFVFLSDLQENNSKRIYFFPIAFDLRLGVYFYFKSIPKLSPFIAYKINFTPAVNKKMTVSYIKDLNNSEDKNHISLYFNQIIHNFLQIGLEYKF